MDFSRNYENKNFPEIQSLFFGHETFTIFTCACYYHCLDNENNGNNDYNDNGLKSIPIAVVSNEVNHERNTASFHCNQEVIKIVCNQRDCAINTVYIRSNGCADQFCSQYVFWTLPFYPPDLKIFWDYGDVHQFKGLHDGIGGTIKHCIYNDVRSSKVIIKNGKHFADFTNEKLNLHVIYLDKKGYRNQC